MRLIISNEANALFTPGESVCDDCDSPDNVLFLDVENDEFCATLCADCLPNYIYTFAKENSDA